jgi:hypothetical protein
MAAGHPGFAATTNTINSLRWELEMSAEGYKRKIEIAASPSNALRVLTEEVHTLVDDNDRRLLGGWRSNARQADLHFGP